MGLSRYDLTVRKASLCRNPYNIKIQDYQEQIRVAIKNILSNKMTHTIWIELVYILICLKTIPLILLAQNEFLY